MSTQAQPLPLSAAIVCRNNQATIGRTLDSLQGLVTEIVAVDSGSADGTIEALERRGARVLRSEWLGHVRTKQLALAACTQAWVLCVDTDEVVLPDLAGAIREALTRDDPAIGGYAVNRKVYYQDRPLNHAWQPEWRLRLVRRGAAAWGGIDPHDKLELLPVNGARAASRLRGCLRHDSFETFEGHLAKQLRYSRLSAEGLLGRGERGSRWRLVISPIGALVKQLVLKQAWRDGRAGWLAAGTQAAGALMKHMILLELTGTAAAPGHPGRDRA